MNKIISFSFVGVLFYVISFFNKALALPSFYKNFCCADDRKLNLFLIFIPIFIIFLLLRKLKFVNWQKFTLLYLVGYLILYFIVPTEGDGFFWFQRETVSLFGTIIYSLSSLVFILYKSSKK